MPLFFLFFHGRGFFLLYKQICCDSLPVFIFYWLVWVKAGGVFWAWSGLPGPNSLMGCLGFHMGSMVFSYGLVEPSKLFFGVSMFFFSFLCFFFFFF